MEERVGERGSSREDDTIIASISATGYLLPVTDFAPLLRRVNWRLGIFFGKKPRTEFHASKLLSRFCPTTVEEKSVKPLNISNFTLFLAESEGFKPPVRTSRTADFESAPFDHSGNFPKDALEVFPQTRCKSMDKFVSIQPQLPLIYFFV